MKKFNTIMISLIFILATLYPILPSYGIFSADTFLYLLIFIQLIGLVFFKEERINFKYSFTSIIKNKLFISVILLNALMYASVFFAVDKHTAFTNSIRFSLYLSLLYFISFKIKDTKTIKLLINAFLGVAFLSGIVTIFQSIAVLINGSVIDSDHRISAFLENSNNLGVYSIFAIFLAIILFIITKNKKFKILYGILTILLTFNIIASQSRNALIALMIGIMLMSLLYDKRYFIGSLFLPLIFLILPISRSRILQIFDISQNSSRFKIWGISKIMMDVNPITGIGYDNFRIEYPRYIESNPDYLIGYSYTPLHPHNAFIKFQVELGILGTIFFLMFILLTSIFIYKAIKVQEDKYFKMILSSILITFIVFQFMNILDCYYVSNKIMLSLFLLLGISVSITNLNGNEIQKIR